VAEGIVRSFLQGLLREAGHDHASSELYRRFLLDRLHAFLAADWRDSFAEEVVDRSLAVPSDMEVRYQRDHADACSPDDTFQRAFALQVLHRAFRRLRNEAEQTAHIDMYDALEPYLACDPGPGEYESTGQRLGRRPIALALALNRLRQRFRELVSEELADTVGSADDLLAEQDALLAVLEEAQR
jgi:RNA polymerase sigma-70 factor (ECF subfamily)